MARPKNLEMRITKVLSLDAEPYKAFENLVGFGNVSDEIREMIKDRISSGQQQQDNNVLKQDKPKPNYIFQDFETKDKRDELRIYIEQEPDMKKLNTLYLNCNSIVGMVERRRIENKSLGNMEHRLRNEQELADHFSKVQKAKHRSISYKGQDGSVKRI